MKKVLIKKEVFLETDGKKKKLSDSEKFVVDETKDFHSSSGKVDKNELQKKPGSKIILPKGEFILLDADFIDLYKKIKRNAQIITLKDIGSIITGTGINRDSKILEAGSGSGAVTCYLAKIAKKIISYDVDERSLATARENVESFGFKNVEIKKGSIYEPSQIKEKGFDVAIIDVPDASKTIETLNKCLKIGGFAVIYAPHIMQIQQFITKLPDEFIVENTIETIEREWAIDEMRTRPVTKDHAHTAFLTFIRKVG